MKRAGIAVMLLSIATLVNVASILWIAHAVDNLRKDVNRTSVVQVLCAGKPNYSQCIDKELERWWTK